MNMKFDAVENRIRMKMELGMEKKKKQIMDRIYEVEKVPKNEPDKFLQAIEQ